MKACLNLSFPGTSVCFGVKAQVAILPAISTNLGCVDVGQLIYQLLGKK
jgi:hypothetical protein